ncbi:hypothetical protein GQ473_03430 [archaeon]|nr:hypothetical protein [archaeon]
MGNERYTANGNNLYKPTLTEQKKLLDSTRHTDWGMEYRMGHHNKK